MSFNDDDDEHYDNAGVDEDPPNPINVAHVCIGMGSSTGAWETHKLSHSQKVILHSLAVSLLPQKGGSLWNPFPFYATTSAGFI